MDEFLGEESDEDIFLEEAVIFYNPAKSHVEEDAYLTAIPYEPKRLVSWVSSLFCDFPPRYSRAGLDELMDFLADEEAESFWDRLNPRSFWRRQSWPEESTFILIRDIRCQHFNIV